MKIKTTDGSICRGEFYFPNRVNRIKDELIQNQEFFVAVTGVSDSLGRPSTSTFLFNFHQIVYLAVLDDDYEERYRSAEEKKADSRIIGKRKVNSFIRLVDKSMLNRTIFVRNTLTRTKDELNIDEGDFILMCNVQEQGAAPEDARTTYFINKEHIIFVAITEDKKEEG